MGNTQGIQGGVFMSTGSLARLASGTYTVSAVEAAEVRGDLAVMHARVLRPPYSRAPHCPGEGGAACDQRADDVGGVCR